MLIVFPNVTILEEREKRKIKGSFVYIFYEI